MGSGALPLVSVICTTYNHSAYIRQCLEGIMMQKTNFSFEVLVHDDASTDNTADIVREFEERYPDILYPIYQKENQYSRGIKIGQAFLYPRARGKYIAECEGDDYWTDPLKLQKQVDFMEAHPAYSMCFHKVEIKNELGLNPDDLLCCKIDDRDYSATELFERWIVQTASTLFRKEVIQYKISGENRVVVGDQILVLRSAQLGKIRGMSDCMSVYRVHSQGVTYNRELHLKIVMGYPEHYECIKENFDVLPWDVLRPELINSYISRMRSGRFFSPQWFADARMVFKYLTVHDAFHRLYNYCRKKIKRLKFRK